MGRSRILQGAIDILDEGVYGDLTVDALARSLRMSKSTLYKFFASKDDVVVALIDAICVDTERAASDVAASEVPPRDRLEALVDVVAKHAERLPRAIVLQQARLPASCQDRLAVTRAALLHAVQGAISRGHATGTFQYPDPTLAGQALLASAEAAMRASARGEVHRSRADAVRALVPLFAPGLEAA